MSEKPSYETQRVAIFSCSGWSNCGQITNAAAAELAKRGVGGLFCLAGLGAHIAGRVESVRVADRILVIDGCPVACASKTVKHVGLQVTDYVEVMSEGIVKNQDYDLKPSDISRVVERALETLENNSNYARVTDE